MAHSAQTQPMDPTSQTVARANLAPAPPTAMAAPSRWTRIIPVALVMYTIAFIDRTNISLAIPRISRDLHLDPQQAGTVAGIFFWGYLALQIPGGHLAKHWSPKKFISVLLVAWSLFAVGCGLAHTYRELLVLRLLLGVAESGVFPATLILLSHWFSRAERESLVATLRAESAELERSENVPYLRALLRPQVFVLAAIYFCFVSGQMGLLFWRPSATENFKKLSSLHTGIVFTFPFIVGAIALLVVARHSDKTRERRKHAATAMALGGLFILLAAAMIHYSPLLAFAFIILSGVGAYGPMAPFWAIPTETLPAKTVGSVMGFVNAIGNLGAYFAPLIVGHLNKTTGNFVLGFAYLGAITVLGAAFCFLLKAGAANAAGASTVADAG